MGNTWGGSGVKRDHSEAFNSKGDASESVRDKTNPLYYMNLAGRKVAFCEELSQEQALALGNYKYELDAAGVDYSGISLLTRGDVFAMKPPRRLKLTEPMRDAIEVAARVLYWINPPDDATIDKMGPVMRYAQFRVYTTQWRKVQRGCKTSLLKHSADSFAEFKEMAFKLNGGTKPDEAFWIKHFKVRERVYKNMEKNKSLFYYHLNYVVKPSSARGPALWATNNETWLRDHGVFSAWEKHRVSADFVGPRGNAGDAGEPKMTDHHHHRLRGTYFVDEYGEEWCVLKVAWDDDYDCNHAFYYDAALGDPPGNGVLYRWPRADGSRWPTIEDCEYSTVEQVDEWIEAGHKPKKRARS